MELEEDLESLDEKDRVLCFGFWHLKHLKSIKVHIEGLECYN